jgi:hypothetical protein
MKQVKIEQLADYTIVVTYERGDGTTFESRNGFCEKFGFPSPPQPLASIRTQERVDKAQDYLHKILSERRPSPDETFVRRIPIPGRIDEHGEIVRFDEKIANALDFYLARLTGAQKEYDRQADLLMRIIEMEDDL